MTAAVGSSALTVKITKRPDGGTLLHCRRRDGSTAWQHQKGHQAMFFPFHDLTHFAVETTLGFRGGFFGMIADGWEILDTTGKGARGAVPREGLVVEQLVGLFDRERVGGAAPLTADEFNAQLEKMIEVDRRFSDAELVATRHRIDELHDQWARLPVGGSIEFPFPR